MTPLTTAAHIPVHQPEIGAQEADMVRQALLDGEISGSGGRFLQEFERRFAEYCGCAHGIATSSGSTALHLAAAVLRLGIGEEVLVSASTNIASANAVALQGATVVPIDAEPDTWNMDPRLLERAVTPRTRAIMPVHLYGHPVDMQPVLDVAEKYGLFVIEDAAEAHGATYRGRRVGGIGDMGCFSFYANKVITTGEGGMVTTNNDFLAERARTLRNLAFGTPRFLHEEVAFNYRMTNVQAAIGVAQLSRIEATLARKREIADGYLRRLAGVRGLQLPAERPDVRNVYWMFALVVQPAEYGRTRDGLMADLQDAGIESRTMFCPMNLQPALRGRMRFLPCPVAENLWTNGLYLPSGCALTDADLDRVSAVVGRA